MHLIRRMTKHNDDYWGLGSWTQDVQQATHYAEAEMAEEAITTMRGNGTLLPSDLARAVPDPLTWEQRRAAFREHDPTMWF